LKKKILKISSWVLVLSVCILLWSFSNIEQSKVTCKQAIVSVDINDENFFLNSKDIIQAIHNSGDSIIGQTMDELNVNNYENLINQIPEVENSEVYKTLHGEIYVNVKQRKPIARIINYKNDGFYIDDKGKLMPLSENFTARVLVVTGNFHHSYAGNNYRNLKKDMADSTELDMEKDLLYSIFRLANFINKNEFWKAQVEQINIENNNFQIIPKAGDHIIVFGDANNIEKKFKKLFNLYQQGLPKVGWNKYESLDLRYEGQIIAKRKQEFIKQIKQR
jgi:cell division protein FtsQ